MCGGTQIAVRAPSLHHNLALLTPDGWAHLLRQVHSTYSGWRRHLGLHSTATGEAWCHFKSRDGQAAAQRHSVPPTLPIRSPSTTTTRLQCSARQRQRRNLQQPLLGLCADALQVLRRRLLLRGTLALHGRTIRLILSRPPRPCRARLLQRAGGGAAGQAACTCAAASCSQGGRRLPAGRPPRLPVQAPLQRQGRAGQMRVGRCAAASRARGTVGHRLCQSSSYGCGWWRAVREAHTWCSVQRGPSPCVCTSIVCTCAAAEDGHGPRDHAQRPRMEGWLQ